MVSRSLTPMAGIVARLRYIAYPCASSTHFGLVSNSMRAGSVAAAHVAAAHPSSSSISIANTHASTESTSNMHSSTSTTHTKSHPPPVIFAASLAYALNVLFTSVDTNTVSAPYSFAASTTR